MEVLDTELPGVLVIAPKVFGDARGYFYESFRSSAYAEAGIDVQFVQDNVSRSAKGTLRGLHLQHPNSQGKLVSVLLGEVFDVAVDVRVGSATFGKWTGRLLSDDNMHQLYVPPGFAHGFAVLSESAVFSYKCTTYYSPSDELSVRWNDPAIGIEWPVASPLLSDKDGGAPLLADVDPARLPRVD